MSVPDHGFEPYRVDFRTKFVRELETWLEDRGFDDALTLFAAFLQKQIDEGADGDAIISMQQAWEEAARVCEPEPDYEAQQAERDRREYEAGKAQAEEFIRDRKMYGPELAEQFERDRERARFNRGDDD